MEIRSVRHRGLRRFIEKDDSRGLSSDLVPRIRRVITALALAQDVESVMAPPGWRLHRLSGDRSDTWSVSVSGNWRITFRVVDGEVVDLNLEDYH